MISIKGSKLDEVPVQGQKLILQNGVVRIYQIEERGTLCCTCSLARPQPDLLPRRHFAIWGYDPVLEPYSAQDTWWILSLNITSHKDWYKRLQQSASKGGQAHHLTAPCTGRAHCWRHFCLMLLDSERRKQIKLWGYSSKLYPWASGWESTKRRKMQPLGAAACEISYSQATCQILDKFCKWCQCLSAVSVRVVQMAAERMSDDAYNILLSQSTSVLCRNRELQQSQEQLVFRSSPSYHLTASPECCGELTFPPSEWN